MDERGGGVQRVISGGDDEESRDRGNRRFPGW